MLFSKKCKGYEQTERFHFSGKNSYGHDCTPYVYCLIWLDEFGVPISGYIGSQYGKNCHPKNLLLEYFTSSKSVRDYIKLKGLPQICQIRKVFEGETAGVLCYDYETRLLKKLKVRKSSFWLNKHENDFTLDPKSFKEAMLKIYGVDCATKHPMIKEKTKQTCLRKYGKTSTGGIEEFAEKSRKTCLERYGVPYPMMNEVVKQKSKNTNFEKYNCYYTQTEIWKEQTRQTCLSKYGVEHHSKTEKFKTEMSKRLKGLKRKIVETNCKFCGEFFNNENGRMTHERYCNKNPNEGYDKEICEHCGKNVIKNSKWHFDRCRKNPLRKIEEKPKKFGTCFYCSKRIVESQINQFHNENCKEKPGNELLRVGKKKKIKCDYCDKSVDAANLKRFHNERCKDNPNRTEEETIFCEFCNSSGKGFAFKSRHMKNCKLNPSKVLTQKEKCNHCGKPSSKSSEYHFDFCKKNKNRLKRETIVCDVCGKSGETCSSFKANHFKNCKFIP